MYPRQPLIPLVLIAVLMSPAAQAQRKTDVITLHNGDRVTGEIVYLFGGVLQLKTDFMGRLDIEWPEIANIKSKYHYELRLSDGQRLYGSFDETARPGQILLTDIFGEHELEWLQVVEIRPLEENFFERLDVYLSATVSYTKASSLRQLSLNTEVNYEDPKSRNTFTGRKDIVDADGDRSNSTRLDVTRAVWLEDRNDAFRSVFANYEDNDELELDHRIGAGMGIGRFFVDTFRSRWTGTLGLQAIDEKFSGQDRNRDAELAIATNYSSWRFTTPEINVDLSFSLYPSLTDSGRVRSDGNLRIRWELVDDLFWDVTAWVTTDNHAEGDKDVDYAITTGIGWKY